MAARSVAVEGDSVRPEPVPRGSETILLVEDEPSVREATAEFLRIQGYQVTEAKDGLEALTTAQRCANNIDLIVTDVVMPNMSGGELAKALESLRPEHEILVCFRIRGANDTGS